MEGMEPAVALDRNSYGQLQPRSVDRLVADLAGRQHGVIARRQLLRIGLTRDEIDYRVRLGRLHVIHRGVYAVGHKRLTLDGRRMAAVLACGDGAALSHRDAAANHRMRQCNRGVFEVTVPRKQRARPGIQLHYARLPADEVTTVRGIPVTTVPRTLLDLAAVRPRREVEMAMKEAEVARLWDRLSLPQLVARHPGHRGTHTIRAILESLAAGTEITKEEIVALFLSLIDRGRLPRPELSRYVEGRECDCVWWERQVVVELDGYAVHGTRRNFESDRERDRILQAAGWRVIRVTWRQLLDDPGGVARDLAALL
jgi:hypothetical protein